MKKSCLLVSVLLFLIVLSGCTAKEDSGVPPLTSFAYEEGYIVDTFEASHTGIDQPRGILSIGDLLYVCDWKTNSIIVLDNGQNPIDQIGSIGSAPLEFIRPTGITADESHIYVIDSGNNRVQVLTYQKEFIKSIPLPAFPEVAFWDIAVGGDKTIYVASNAIIPNEAHIYMQRGDSAFKALDVGFSGKLYAADGKVFALETYELETLKDGYRIKSGKNNLYQIERDSVIKIAAWPMEYTAGDFLVDNNNIVCLSTAYLTLDVFRNNGDYQATLVGEQKYLQTFAFDVSMAVNDEGSYFVTNFQGGEIVKIWKK